MLVKLQTSDMTTLSNFAHGLLTQEDLIIDGVNTTLVSGFDQSEFSKKSVPSSLYYDVDLSYCNVLPFTLIQVEHTWSSWELLLGVPDALAEQQGWKIKKKLDAKQCVISLAERDKQVIGTTCKQGIWEASVPLKSQISQRKKDTLMVQTFNINH